MNVNRAAMEVIKASSLRMELSPGVDDGEK
jgi:hypothetical protein